MTSRAARASTRDATQRPPAGLEIGAPDLSWTWHRFADLPPRLLYCALRLRQDIFIVEQDVAYADLDGRDLESVHLIGTSGDAVVAYLRVLPKNLFKPGCYSFGRVTVRRDLRGIGLGRKLVAHCIERLDDARGEAPIEISSQHYLENFYRSFGFVPYGNEYVEDKIVHIAMRRP